VKSGMAGARSAFQANDEKTQGGGSCGSGDSSQRDELLARMRSSKDT